MAAASDHERVRETSDAEDSCVPIDQLFPSLRRAQGQPEATPQNPPEAEGGEVQVPGGPSVAPVGVGVVEPRGEEVQPQGVSPAPEAAAGPSRPGPSALGTRLRRDPLVVEPQKFFKAESIPSRLRKSDLISMRLKYNLPADIKTKLMSVDERSTRPPVNAVAFNAAIMQYGARLPLHPLVRGVLNSLNLSPTQLNPNAYRIMACTCIVWRRMGESTLTPREFLHLYCLRGIPLEKGYYYFSKYDGGSHLIGSIPSSCEGWKDRNFWLGGNFDPESSRPGAVAIPRNYRLLDLSAWISF